VVATVPRGEEFHSRLTNSSGVESSSAGESHPDALADPDVSLSARMGFTAKKSEDFCLRPSKISAQELHYSKNLSSTNGHRFQ
jgi:hypothetical protein